jgi:hypothetical protein
MLERRLDESGEQRVRVHWARLEFGVKLTAKEPRMVRKLYHLNQGTVRGQSAAAHAVLLESIPVGVVDLVAVPMTFADLIGSIDLSGT